MGTSARSGSSPAPYVRELHLHCYRMLGSVTDADDLLQEILSRRGRGSTGFAGRASLRTWLYRIATNRCLNAIRDGSAARRPSRCRRSTRRSRPAAATSPGCSRTRTPDPRTGRRTSPGRPSSWRSSRRCSAYPRGRPPPSSSWTSWASPPPRRPGMLGDRPTAVKGLLQRGRSTLSRDQHGRPSPGGAADRARAGGAGGSPARSPTATWRRRLAADRRRVAGDAAGTARVPGRGRDRGVPAGERGRTQCRRCGWSLVAATCSRGSSATFRR